MGTLAGGVRLRNMDIESPQGLPPGTRVRVQELRVGLSPLSLEDSTVHLSNGRVFLPSSDDPIVLFGSYRDRMLEANVFSHAFGVQDLSELGGGRWDLPKGLSGTVQRMDCTARGSPEAARVDGRLTVKALSYRGFSLRDSPVKLMLRLRRKEKKTGLRGQIVFFGGDLVSRATTVKLGPSRLRFTGDPKQPQLALRGVSIVEGTRIRIALKGTPARPEILLASEPPLPQQQLLLMLATGKGWKGTETLLTGNQIPIDLARDFLDVFFFSGSGGAFWKQFGLADVSVTYDTETGGIGVKKPLTERTEVRYGATPVQGEGGQPPQTSHSVGAELKVTDRVSVEAEGKMRPSDPQADPQAKAAQADGKVVIKYKRKF